MTRGEQRGPAVVDGVQAEAVRRAGLDLYTKPHENKRPAAFDWSATRPTCNGCGQRSSQVGSDGLCPACRDPKPAPTPAAPKRRTASTPKPRTTPPRRTATPKPPKPELDRDQVASLYASGLTIRQVAQQLGVANHAVTVFMREQGIARRAQGEQMGRRGTPVDERAIVAAYRAGAIGSDLAREHGVDGQRIRKILDRHGVQRRDERTLRSGGAPRSYDDATVAEVRRLYLDEQLSQSQVAERLRLTAKVVGSIMRRHEITARQGQCGRGDTTGGVRQRLNELGVAAAQVRAWAHENGVQVNPRGFPSKAVIEAYAEAHAESQTVEDASLKDDDELRCPKCGASSRTAQEAAPTQQGWPVLACGGCKAATLASKWAVERPPAIKTIAAPAMEPVAAPVIEGVVLPTEVVETCSAEWEFDTSFYVKCALPAGHEGPRHVATIRGNDAVDAVVGW